MSLPVAERRALDQIEKTLAEDHPGLRQQFAPFNLLNFYQAMPGTERVSALPWGWPRWMRPRIAAALALVLVTGVLLAFSLLLPSEKSCATGADAAVAAQLQSIPAAPPPACMNPRNGPGRATSSATASPGSAHP